MTQPNALSELLAINERIGAAESAADADWFELVLHDRFTMRRPSGPLSSKEDFIAGLAVGAQRVTTMTAVQVHGEFRATAHCLVAKWDLATPEKVQTFDNLRVFIHQDGRWQLITWLAEPI